MTTNRWNNDFLVANTQRRYPLADSAGGQDQSGSFELPDDFIVQMDLPVHAGMDIDPSRFFVRQVGAYATGYSVLIAYEGSGGPVNVATALINRDAHERYTTYTLGGQGQFVDTLGKVVIGKLENIDQQPDGSFTFNLADGRLDPDAIRPMIQGVSSIAVNQGGEISERLQGDIELVAGQNIQLVPIQQAGEDPQIRINAVEDDFEESCICEGQESAPPIRRINGLPPTPNGDFTLVGNDCLDISPIDNGLFLEDVCANPCCGCQELETVTRELEQFGNKATTLENFLNRLESSVTTLDQIVLGSKLNDTGCP